MGGRPAEGEPRASIEHAPPREEVHACGCRAAPAPGRAAYHAHVHTAHAFACTPCTPHMCLTCSHNHRRTALHTPKHSQAHLGERVEVMVGGMGGGVLIRGAGAAGHAGRHAARAQHARRASERAAATAGARGWRRDGRRRHAAAGGHCGCQGRLASIKHQGSKGHQLVLSAGSGRARHRQGGQQGGGSGAPPRRHALALAVVCIAGGQAAWAAAAVAVRVVTVAQHHPGL